MRTRRRLTAVALSLALLAAACRSADDDAADIGRSGDGDSTSQSDDRFARSPRATTGGGDDTASDSAAGDGETATTSQDDAFETSETEAATASPGARIDDGRDRRTRPPVTVEPPRGDIEAEHAGVNPFVDVSVDPLSTFALDVDTASFTLSRQWLEQGLLPDPAAVRVEEIVNYLDPGYEPPSRDVFAVYADGAPHPFVDDDTHLLRIGIAAEEVTARGRDDVRLTFVVDVSGSMSGDGRLELVKDALHLLTDQLDGADRVAIVAYDDRAWEVLEPTDGDRHDRIHDAIDELWPGGSTNAEAGLELGYELARDMFDDEATNRVILASDGVANVGDTSAGGIWDRIAEDAGRGIHMAAVGVGFGTYNDALLEQLANQGNGFYAYVDDHGEAERLFVEELTGTLQTVAQDAKVQVEFDEDNVRSYRLIGFENRDVADRDFDNDRVDAGEIGAGHTVTALYEVELARGVDPGDGAHLATVHLRWSAPGTTRADQIDGKISTDVLWSRVAESGARFRLAATAATFAEWLRDSRYVRGVSLDALAREADAVARELRGDSSAGELADLIDLAIRAA